MANVLKQKKQMNKILSLFSGIGGMNVRQLHSEVTDLSIIDGGSDDKRMSSREIARITGKRHDAVLRDIRKLLKQQVNAHNFVEVEYIDKKGEKRPCFSLTKKGCLILASGYDARLREKIIDRWATLELRNQEEKRDPSKAVSRAVSNWKKQGKSDKWIETRTQSVVRRHLFTDTLKAHGVEGKGYGQCTNAIYKPLLGGSKSEVVEKRKLPQGANLRDTLSGVELASVMLSEALAAERIETHHARGNSQCAEHSSIAATNVSRAVSESRR